MSEQPPHAKPKAHEGKSFEGKHLRAASAKMRRTLAQGDIKKKSES